MRTAGDLKLLRANSLVDLDFELAPIQIPDTFAPRDFVVGSRLFK